MPAPNLPIRIGVVGLSTNGGWASTLLAPLFDPKSSVHLKYKLVALATRTAESASATAEKYSSQIGSSVKAYHGDSGVLELAQDPDVDVVVVTVKVGDHKKTVLPAIEAGKDVFEEWPLGRGLQEASEIAEKAKEKGVRGAVGTQGIYTPIIRKIKEVVRSGGIGKVVSTTFITNIDKSDPLFGGETISERHTYATEAHSGATHSNILGGHLLSGLTEVLGPISHLSSTLNIRYPDLTVVGKDNKPTGQTSTRHNADQVIFSGLLASGAAVTFQIVTGTTGTATGGQIPFRWTINGEQGSIEAAADSWAYTMRPVKLTVNGEAWTPDYEWDYLTGPIQKGWDEFSKGEVGEYATFDDAVNLHRIVDAILSSDRKGIRVEIPPSKS